MNYIIENNIDFFSELHKELDPNLNSQSETETMFDKDNICLITHQPLEFNFITLNCKHKFNYLPLYNEVSNQKINNYLETTHLSINQIKCPYCRTITNKLLPYIEHNDVIYKKGVNFPIKYCMKLYNCQWVTKSGKNKGNLCGKEAHKSELGIYCTRCKQKQINNSKNNNSLILWTEQHEAINKKYNVIKLKEILRENKIKVGGTKKQLVDRIINYTLV